MNLFKKTFHLTLAAMFLGALAPFAMAFTPTITNTPDLPVINWPAGVQAPAVMTDQTLRQSDRALIVWTNAEWAALMHVFCYSTKTMPYNYSTASTPYNKGNPVGWTKYTSTSQYPMPYSSWSDGSIHSVGYWFWYSYVDLGNGITVCLVKANIHLDNPYFSDAAGKNPISGEVVFNQMMDLIDSNVQPKLFVTTGTAGGASVFQTLGTSMAVSYATYQQGTDQSTWITYPNAANYPIWLPKPNLSQALALTSPVPVTSADLNSIVSQFNTNYTYNFTLAQLDPDQLLIQSTPAPMYDYTYQTSIALLTCSDFLTGTNDNQYGKYAFLEMDDAVIFQYYQKIFQNSGRAVVVGSVRDLSDPVQNVNLTPTDAQSNWGSAIYGAYGFYTAYNSAILSWACLTTGNISAPATQN